jgi:hypothetical protein
MNAFKQRDEADTIQQNQSPYLLFLISPFSSSTSPLQSLDPLPIHLTFTNRNSITTINMGSPKDPKDLEVASIFFGLFLGLLFFTSTKVVRQSRSIWKRTQSLSNWYLWMIWVEVTVNFIFALTTYMYIHGIILPRYVGFRLCGTGAGILTS